MKKQTGEKKRKKSRPTGGTKKTSTEEQGNIKERSGGGEGWKMEAGELDWAQPTASSEPRQEEKEPGPNGSRLLVKTNCVAVYSMKE